MRRVQSHRADHRQQLLLEVLAQPFFLRVAPLAAAHEMDLLVRELRDQHFVEDPVLLTDHLVGPLADGGEDLGGRLLVGVDLHRAGFGLLQQARDPDLEELVEVGAADAEELEALEQRIRRILRLLEHAMIELELAQLAVEVERRILEIALEGLVGGDGH